jgi:hypothetical protein
MPSGTSSPGWARLKITGATITLVALCLVLALPAGAEEVTRTSYREAAEPICRANVEANERILAGVRSEVKRGKLKLAARRFRRAAVALHGTLGELKRLPRPQADRARLGRWLGFIATEVRLLEKTSRYLAAGEKGAAEGMVVRLKSVANRANNAVFAFEFEYCRLDPARFS